MAHWQSLSKAVVLIPSMEEKIGLKLSVYWSYLLRSDLRYSCRWLVETMPSEATCTPACCPPSSMRVCNSGPYLVFNSFIHSFIHSVVLGTELSASTLSYIPGPLYIFLAPGIQLGTSHSRGRHRNH